MIVQSLFPTDDPAKPTPLPPSLPHNGTTTSQLAAMHAKPFAGQQQQEVFEFIKSQGERGATDQEIETALGLAGNSVRPRRSNLVHFGHVKDSGQTRLTKSGRSAVVWVVCPPDQPRTPASKADWPSNDKTNPDKPTAPAEWVLDFAI